MKPDPRGRALAAEANRRLRHVDRIDMRVRRKSTGATKLREAFRQPANIVEMARECCRIDR
jgi:hypothetical protein